MLDLFILTVGTAVLVFLLTGHAVRRGWLLDPVNSRSNHVQPTSRAGGLVVLAVAVLVVALFVVQGHMAVPSAGIWFALGAGALGVADDIRALPARPKLLVLSILSILAVRMVGPVTVLPLPAIGVVVLPYWAGFGLSAFFLLGFANAFNFMDGLNGMAAGMGIVGLALTTVLGGGTDASIVAVALILAAATFGFGVRNVWAGTIFFGDGGSLFLGFFLGVAAIQSSSDGGLGFYIGAIAFLPIILDTGVTLLWRWRRNQPLLDAHRDHFYQRLRHVGWSHQAVALAYASMMAVGAVAAWLAAQTQAPWALVIAALAVTALFILTLTVMLRRGVMQSL